MSAQGLITEHLDLWTGAVKKKSSSGRGSNGKVELTGIKKLRELILDLALQGKLTDQQPNDESAQKFLDKLNVKRQDLKGTGAVRKFSAIPPVNEHPFAIPNNWSWTRLGEIGVVGSSRRVRQSDWQPRGVPFYRAREIVKLSQNGQVDNELFISELLYTELAQNGQVPEVGDLMLTGVGTIGVPYIVKQSDRFYFKDASVLIFKNLFGVCPEFLYYFCHSPFWTKAIHADSMGTTVHTLTIIRANLALIPLPPIEEQHRIVQKVDELMALCDQLEQKTSDQLEAHEALVDTLLATLTQSENATELADSWARLAAHFDTLFTTEKSIEKLKQTILQLAVMGRLVEQDAEDEPAVEVVKRMNKKKSQLLSDKLIKKQKELPDITEAEKPISIPTNWAFARLDDICTEITSGSTPPKSEFDETFGIPYLKVYNIRSQRVDFQYKSQFVTEKYHQAALKRSKLLPGDVVMNIVGPPLGKTAIIPDDHPEWNCNQAIVRFRPIEIELSQFIHLYLKAGTFLKTIELIGTAGQDNISVTKSRSIVIPLPPKSEQHRIVQKVDEMMTLCDQLKERLNQASETRCQLANAVVEQALH